MRLVAKRSKASKSPMPSPFAAPEPATAASDVDAQTGPAYLSINVVQPGALGPEDAEELTEDLKPNSSALLIAFENIWAQKVVDACRDADAVMIDQIRIPADVVEAVVAAS